MTNLSEKIPENIRNSLKKNYTIKELIRETPWNFIDILISAFLLLFILQPLYQMTRKEMYFSYVTTITTVNAIVVFFGVFTLILIAVKGKLENHIKKLYFNKTTALFAFMIAMIVLSAAVNGFNAIALHGHIIRKESIFTYIFYITVYFYCSSMITSQKAKAVLIYSFIFTSTVLAVTALVHTAFPIGVFENPSGLALIFRNSNHYAYYIVMSILLSSVLVIKEKNTALRIFCMASFVLNTVVLIINNTFGCYLAGFVALIFAIIVISLCEGRFNRLSVAMLALYVVITLIMSIWFNTVASSILAFGNDLSGLLNDAEDAYMAGSGRWKLWTITVTCIGERPLLGFGVDGIEDRLEGGGRTHCEFLQYAAFFGIPAAVSYVSGVFTVYLNGLKRRNELGIYEIAALIAAFAYLVSSAFGISTLYVSPYFFIFLGLGFNRNEK